MAALLKKGLEREGYAVDVAGSGQDAVWMADENEYDVIVLDIILESGGSSIDGFAVWRKIRTADCRTPVLMVTARDAVQYRVRGLDIGADDYLAKPFSLPELLARVRALIRRGAAEQPNCTITVNCAPATAAHRTRQSAPCGSHSCSRSQVYKLRRYPFLLACTSGPAFAVRWSQVPGQWPASGASQVLPNTARATAYDEGRLRCAIR